MIAITKPKTEDLEQIKNILTQWTDPGEVDKYIERIGNEINGKTEFNMHFWVAKEDEKILGVTGISNPLPVILPPAKTPNPAEIKIMYVDGNSQGKGIGKMLINFIEHQAKSEGYTELMVRSANRYKFTAYGFYEKCGYEKSGLIEKEGQETMQVFSKNLANLPVVN
jgi:GNAT superfamily N-acetyltransferase